MDEHHHIVITAFEIIREHHSISTGGCGSKDILLTTSSQETSRLLSTPMCWGCNCNKTRCEVVCLIFASKYLRLSLKMFSRSLQRYSRVHFSVIQPGQSCAVSAQGRVNSPTRMDWSSLIPGRNQTNEDLVEELIQEERVQHPRAAQALLKVPSLMLHPISQPAGPAGHIQVTNIIDFS